MESQRGARQLVERLAIAMQASILLRHGDAVIAQAFIQSRIAPNGERAAAGGLHGGAAVFSASDAQHIIGRNIPVFNPKSSLNSSFV